MLRNNYGSYVVLRGGTQHKAMRKEQLSTIRQVDDLHTSAARATEDFFILCPGAAKNSGALEALYALYYLPKNYKLMIGSTGRSDAVTHSKLHDLVAQEALASRIMFDTQDIATEAGLSSKASPFSFADVVVYGNDDPVFADTAPQSLVVFNIADGQVVPQGEHDFTVCESTPEALASAILRVAQGRSLVPA
jgi:hypothetical protein